MLMHALRLASMLTVLLGTAWLAEARPAVAEAPPPPVSVSDYDEGDFYLIRGDQKLPYHGMRDAWVYNRAMTWLDRTAGVEGTLLCYSEQSPLLLTGAKQVSRCGTRASRGN
jgi:hypothetical protein